MVGMFVGEEEVVECVYFREIKGVGVVGEDTRVDEDGFVLFLDKEAGVEMFRNFHCFIIALIFYFFFYF